MSLILSNVLHRLDRLPKKLKYDITPRKFQCPDCAGILSQQVARGVHALYIAELVLGVVVPG